MMPPEWEVWVVREQLPVKAFNLGYRVVDPDATESFTRSRSEPESAGFFGQEFVAQDLESLLGAILETEPEWPGGLGTPVCTASGFAEGPRRQRRGGPFADQARFP